MSTGNRVLCSLILSLAFYCLAAAPAHAQRGRGFGFGPNRAQLATLKEVQEELKLTPEQIQAASDATKTFNGAVGELFGAAAGDNDKVRAGMPPLHEKATAKINEKLSPMQSQRLTEIFVQQNGVNSVFDPQVRAALKLTDDQMTVLQALRAKNREEGIKATRAMPQGETREARSARFELLWKEAEERILAVLSPKQNEQFQSLRGAELEVNVRPLFPPPPPPRKGNNRDFNS